MVESYFQFSRVVPLFPKGSREDDTPPGHNLGKQKLFLSINHLIELFGRRDE